MVSIPDWSKFARLQENYEKTNTSVLHRYHKQQENEIIRRAEEQGYFITPTEDYLIQNCRSSNPRSGKVKHAAKLLLVKLPGAHMRDIGAIGACTNLQICILSNNFLTKIDGLASCQQLVKLDLHGNQLTSVPGIAFWSGMRRLKVLHLHDNPLGKYEVLQNLATCPRLMILTLYDTPLSLKRNYRHHVVNSVWSLKALDSYVISDEEIIEDAVFGGKFRAMHQAFRIESIPQMPEDTTYDEELSLVQAMEALINQILAHHSPVLIVQRFVRGHLVRKLMSMTGFPKKAKTVVSTLPVIASELVPPPPSCSPAFSGIGQIGLDLSYQEIMGIDYDSYVKTHGPGSVAQSDLHTHPESIPDPHPSPQELDQPPSSRISSPRKKLFIDLSKLQSGTFQSLYDDSNAIETVIPSESLEKVDSGMKKKSKRRKKEKETTRKVVKTVKQFFGPVIESTASQEESVKSDESEDEAPLTNYRLKGYKPNINLIDPTTELILTKQEAGRVVRDAEADHHRKVQELPRPKIPPRKSLTTDQRMFARVHRTMGMSCLFAVHQAYRDREKAEKSAARMEHILSLKDERDRAKERIRLYHEEKRNHALKQRDYERARMLDSLEKRELMRLSYLDRRQDIRNKSSGVSRSYKADHTFLTEFSNQHTSVSNALMRHDRQSQYDDQIMSKSDFVRTNKSSEKDQQETVKKYLEHRQLMRQTESAMARASLDTKMLSEANDRVMFAKSRVAQQKARTETVQTFYPLPQTTPAPITQSSCSAPPLVDYSSKWENGSLLSQGRVGKHPTMVR
ncbi:hypothetical protein ScPMuIL_009866 [Solemya velum]